MRSEYSTRKIIILLRIAHARVSDSPAVQQCCQLPRSVCRNSSRQGIECRARKKFKKHCCHHIVYFHIIHCRYLSPLTTPFTVESSKSYISRLTPGNFQQFMTAQGTDSKPQLKSPVQLSQRHSLVPLYPSPAYASDLQCNSSGSKFLIVVQYFHAVIFSNVGPSGRAV